MDYGDELQVLWQQKEQPVDRRFEVCWISDILPPLFQMRMSEKPDEAFAELVNSIKHTGIIEPLVVRRERAAFRLVVGSRRLRAAAECGLKVVPVVVKDVDDVEAELIALSENLQRKDLSAAEKCEVLIHLYGSAGYDADTTARYLSALTNRHYQAEKYAKRKAYSDRIPVPDDFRRLAEKTGLNFATQCQFLRLRVIPPDILAHAEEKKLPAYKVIELATPEFLAKSDEEKKAVIDQMQPGHKGHRPISAKNEYSLAQLADDEKKVKASGGFAVISMAKVYLPAADLEYFKNRAKKGKLDLGSCISQALMFKSARTRTGECKSKIQDWFSYKNRGCAKVQT